jgi:hypothetical protein
MVYFFSKNSDFKILSFYVFMCTLGGFPLKDREDKHFPEIGFVFLQMKCKPLPGCLSSSKQRDISTIPALALVS